MFPGSKRQQLMELAQRQEALDLLQGPPKNLRKVLVRKKGRGKKIDKEVGKEIKKIQRSTLDVQEEGEGGKNAEWQSELY